MSCIGYVLKFNKPNPILYGNKQDVLSIFIFIEASLINVAIYPSLEVLFLAIWVFGPVVIPFPKKSHSSIRVWVQSPGSSNIRVCEFRLEFLSYKKKKKVLFLQQNVLREGLRKYWYNILFLY